ncbi:anti-sigma factor RsbA family regulatory protein [Geodermatophilus sp. DSM 45219]|uniref:anti-sigma factor RsbA family regulatory protein n=1 Tax=Geodermatophilus sp. DSM 45219 TaxID=1881103 RepID=UPI00088A001A|nr:anti-sigma factor RsbA family regulatory protein [Geodermatophilus sp. DSM 45219]SDO06628.1 Anti-sigma regulatory factor (Ser/Thr protein kinase) [Geodermatophilus sp. DSM 45219]
MDRAPSRSRAPAGLPQPRAGARARSRHAAAVVRGDGELLSVALTFLDAGLRAGDVVALTCPPEVTALLCAELGERAGRVRDEPRLSLLGARAPDALAHARRMAEQEADGRQLRILCLVDFGPAPADWREGLRFESAANSVMADTPIDSLCLYDRRRLPPAVVEAAAATHPYLVHDGAWAPSSAYRHPAEYLPRLPWPREPVEDAAPVFVLDDAPGLVALRHELGLALAAWVPDRDQREDLHLAAAEVAANAFRHGERPVSARMWADGDRLVCAITDSGRTFADPMAGFRPAHGADLGRGGMGLWLARKLWDSVDLSLGPGGLTVRLAARLQPA